MQDLEQYTLHSAEYIRLADVKTKSHYNAVRRVDIVLAEFDKLIADVGNRISCT